MDLQSEYSKFYCVIPIEGKVMLMCGGFLSYSSAVW